jgi:hypothetical protein
MMPLITREELASLGQSAPRLAAFAASGFKAFTPPGRMRSGLVALVLAGAVGGAVPPSEIPRPVRMAEEGGYGVHVLSAIAPAPIQPADAAQSPLPVLQDAIIAQQASRALQAAAHASAFTPFVALAPQRPSLDAVAIPHDPPAAAQATSIAKPGVMAASAEEPPVPAGLQRAVLHASRSTGIGAADLLALAWMETRMAGHARNPDSSAVGPFQFLKVAWFEAVMRFGQDHGMGSLSSRIGRLPDGSLVVDHRIRKALMELRDDPSASATMAAASLASSRPAVEDATGRPMGLADMYVVHLLGPTGAIRFLTALRERGGVPCDAVVPDVIEGNWNLFARDGRVLSVSAAYHGIDAMIQARREVYERLFPAPALHKLEGSVDLASAGPGPGMRP